jgi:hypothetical protein
MNFINSTHLNRLMSLYKRMFAIIRFFIMSVCFIYTAEAQVAESYDADSLVKIYYNNAKACYDRNQYDSSYKFYKLLFAQQAWIPDEAAFFYGKTQYKRKKYQLAKNAFVKYLKLKGNKAALSDSSIYYLNLIDCEINGFVMEEVVCDKCAGTGTAKVKCEKCKGVGKIYCPVCGGKGVVVSVNGMVQSYQRCQKCQGTGAIVCPQCNGSLYSQGECPTCKGSGTIGIKKPCTH